MPRAGKQSPKARHDPLLKQLREDEFQAKYGKVSQPGKRAKKVAGEDADEGTAEEVVLDPKTSKRIFDLARDQQAELEDQEDADDDVLEDENDALKRPRTTHGMEDDDEEEEEEIVYEEYEYDPEAEFQVDAGDLQTLDALLPPNAGQRKTLADLIFAKLDEAESNPQPDAQGAAVIRPSRQNPDEPPDPALGLHPKVVEAYTKAGTLLRTHRTPTGLPKLIKLLPALPAWARLLVLTEPENWSPQATHAVTRVFVPQMKPAQARVFLERVLLEAVRADIRGEGEGGGRKKANRPLNVHYYEALKRAVYKPAAFYKGIVFPLLESGCTLKEAAIVASVISKKKIPVLHSSAALIRIAEMDYAGPNSLFIRVLLDKKYTFPYKVVDALVFHFIRLANTYRAKKAGDAEKLPVLWHQSLLVFCQRYASELTPEQKDALLDVVRAHPHPQIGPEVRREIVSAVARGEPVPGADADGDVAMS